MDKMRAVQHVYLVQIPITCYPLQHRHICSLAPLPSFMAQHRAGAQWWMSHQRVKETMGCVTAEELQKGLVLLNSIHEGTLSKDAAKVVVWHMRMTWEDFDTWHIFWIPRIFNTMIQGSSLTMDFTENVTIKAGQSREARGWVEGSGLAA